MILYYQVISLKRFNFGPTNKATGHSSWNVRTVLYTRVTSVRNVYKVRGVGGMLGPVTPRK